MHRRWEARIVKDVAYNSKGCGERIKKNKPAGLTSVQPVIDRKNAHQKLPSLRI
jgi:hypothetical protein